MPSFLMILTISNSDLLKQIKATQNTPIIEGATGVMEQLLINKSIWYETKYVLV